MDGKLMLRLTEYRYWSPVMGCDAVRVSSFDARGDEFYMLLEEHSGASWRCKRQEAAEIIDLAMRQGLPPGEVRLLQ